MRRLIANFVLMIVFALCAPVAFGAQPLQSGKVATPPSSILDEVGLLGRNVSPDTVAGWRKQAANPSINTVQLAQLHIWLGEYLLAHDQQPKKAEAEFQTAYDISPGNLGARGLAEYNTAEADFYQGAYGIAADEFKLLLENKTGLHGFPRKDCALWLRHASACAAYHAARARVGIPEPPQLDPNCGAAAIATCLRNLSHPFSEKYVLSQVRPTGEGNNLFELVDSANRLNVHIRALRSGDSGLIVLPKPLVAFVERDHFVAVTKADASGVTYVCSDCGPWPGGEVHLSWLQWDMMEPDRYAIVSVPGSNWDKAMTIVFDSKSSTTRHEVSKGIQIASLSLPSGLGSMLSVMEIVNLIKTHAISNVTPSPHDACGDRPNGLKCKPNVNCPLDPNPAPCGCGDPVNMATGEEEYTPQADITVYNAIGPSVSWSRIYDSLRGLTDETGYNGGTTAAITYDYDDYGVGWSNGYNMAIYDPTNGGTGERYLIMPNGARIPFHFGTVANGSSASTTFDVPEQMEITWFNNSYYGYYYVTMPDHSQMQFGSNNNSLPMNSQNCLQLRRVYDKFGNFIMFQYGSSAGSSGWWPLSQINDGNGSALVTISRVASGSTAGSVSSVTDKNGLSVYYGTTTVSTYNVPAGYPQDYLELQYVSILGLTNNSFAFTSTTEHYKFDYVQVGNGEGSETTPSLQDIFVQSPQTFGTFSAITYAYDTNGFVTSVTDPNNNKRSYTDSLGTTTTTLSISGGSSTNYDVSGHSYPNYGGRTVSYDQNSTTTASSDNAGVTTYATSFTGTADIYRPILSQDGNSSALTLNNSLMAYPPLPAGNSESVPATSSGTVSHTTWSWNVSNAGGYLASGSNTVTHSNGWTLSSFTPTSITLFISATAANNIGLLTVTVSSNNMGTIATETGQFTVRAADSSMLGVTSDTWDGYDHLTSEITPYGAVTTNQYTTSVDPLPVVLLSSIQDTDSYYSDIKAPTTYAYVNNGNPGALAVDTPDLVNVVKSPVPGTLNSSSSVTTTYYYDFQGNTAYPTNQGILGNVVATVAPGYAAGQTITTKYIYTYNTSPPYNSALGEPLTVTDNLGNHTEYTYDGRGNMLSVEDAQSNTTTYAYNVANQLTDEYSADSISHVNYVYEYTGGPLQKELTYDTTSPSTPVLTREIDYAYGPAGELLSATADNKVGVPAMPSSSILYSYQYDALYRVEAITDGNGNTTTYQYNLNGYLAKVDIPNFNTATIYQYGPYDADGNCLKRIDGNSKETDYAYSDPSSQLTGVTYPSLSSSYYYVYGYDPFGRQTSMTDNTGSTSYAYDDIDGVTGTTRSFTGGPQNISMTYTFNPDGSRASVTGQSPSANTYTWTDAFTYTYDADGRMSALTNPHGDSFSWTYYGNDWLSSQVSDFKSGSSQNLIVSAGYMYNARGLTTDLKNHNGGTTYSEFSTSGTADTQYDASGNRVTWASSYPGPTAYGGGTTYVYDYKDEVASESTTRNGGPGTPVGNTFDSAGNILTLRGGASQSYNAGNQDYASGYYYDENGNPTTYLGTTLAFDPENRMTSYGSSASYAYDANGMEASSTNGSATTWYVYDTDGSPLFELGSGASIQAANAFGADGLLSRSLYSGSAFSSEVYYAFDLQGSTVDELSSSGAATATMFYDAFGSRTKNGTGGTDPYAYYGAQWGYRADPTSGLELLTHRWYDTTTGRFLTRDPDGYDGGMNLYGYCTNNSSNKIDPMGTHAAAVPKGPQPGPPAEPAPTPPSTPEPGPAPPVACPLPTVPILCAGLMLACTTPAGEQTDPFCDSILLTLQNNNIYFSTRPWYFPGGGKALDPGHRQSLEDRCRSYSSLIPQVQECLDSGKFGKQGSESYRAAEKILGKSYSNFNRLCPQIGYSPTPSPKR